MNTHAYMEANPIVLCEKAERHDGMPDPIDTKPPSLWKNLSPVLDLPLDILANGRYR